MCSRALAAHQFVVHHAAASISDLSNDDVIGPGLQVPVASANLYVFA